MNFRQSCQTYLTNVKATKTRELGWGNASSLYYHYQGLEINVQKDYAHVRVIDIDFHDRLDDTKIFDFGLFKSTIDILLLYLEIKSEGKADKLIHKGGNATFVFGVVEIFILVNPIYRDLVRVSCPKETNYLPIDYDKIMQHVIAVNEVYDKKEGIVSRFFSGFFKQT